MDQRKKLTETYIPDKKSTGGMVVIGLTGGIKSMVAASLLKIQKYDLIAVTVIADWETPDLNQEQVRACHLPETNRQEIRDFCHRLGIPHHFVKIGAEFSETVIEKWKAGLITGSFSLPCGSCHELRMKHLYLKMRQLGARKLATGHLAKVFHQDGQNSTYVHTSNDEENDQSVLLAGLSHEILTSLLLPLSDLQLREVKKLAENFGLEGRAGALRDGECFSPTAELSKIVLESIPRSLLRSGEISTVEETNLGTHEGFLAYEYGKAVKLEDVKTPLFSGGSVFPERKLIVVTESHFLKKEFLLSNCRFSEEWLVLGPVRGVVHLSGTDYIEGWISPLPLGAAYVELDQPGKVLEGQTLAILKKKGRNSKVHLTGTVRYLPEQHTEENENEKSDPGYRW